MMRKINNFIRLISLVLFLVVSLLLVFHNSVSPAAPLEEGAKQEGSVLFYSGMSTGDSQTLLNAFQKKYPFVKAEFYRSTESTMLQKARLEKQMGRGIADVFHTASIWVNLYKKEGLFGKYVSPETKFFPIGFKDPDGFWTTYYTAYYSFLYNTRMVVRKDLPRTYEDLLNPMWKGRKIGMQNDEIEWFMGMLDYLGKEKGMQFMKRLADQDPMLRAGRTLVTSLMVAGEFPLALGNVHRMLELQKTGAPLDMIHFPVPVLAAMRMIGINANAPHPNAARLLVDFVLSKDGQSTFTRISRHPVRLDVPVEPVVEVIRRNLFPIKPRDVEVAQGYKREYDNIFKKRGD